MRIFLTAMAFFIGAFVWSMWKEFVPPGAISWGIGILISVGIFFGVWDWAKRFEPEKPDRKK